MKLVDAVKLQTLSISYRNILFSLLKLPPHLPLWLRDVEATFPTAGELP